MPDTPELLVAFGQPTHQSPGCGFPVVRLFTLFHAATGLLMRMLVTPLRAPEAAHVTALHRNRTVATKKEPQLFGPRLDPETYHDARTVAPGWDVYELEREWRDWMTEPPRHPDAAFIGFCKKWFEKRGLPRR